MSNSLMDQWGLGEPDGGKTDDQSNDFRDSYSDAIKPVVVILETLVGDGETAAGAELTGLLDQAYLDYQNIAKAIDPQDPAKMEKDIEDFLGGLPDLLASAEALQAKAAAARQEWVDIEPDFTTASGQAEEIDEWGADSAGPLLALARDTVDLADARNWPDAVATAKDLIKQVAQPYADYQKQREAKDRFDQDRPSLDSAVESAVGDLAEAPSVAPALQAARDALRSADDKADGRDYVAACDLLPAAETAIASLTSAAGDLRKKREEYEQLLSQIDPRISALPSGFRPLAGLEDQTLRPAFDAMQDRAKALDFAAAVDQGKDLMSELDGHAQQVEDLQRKQSEYETRSAAAAPRIDTAVGSGYTPLEGMEQSISERCGEMESFAESHDYDEALAALDRVEAMLDGHEEAVRTFQEQQAAYEARREALLPRLDEAEAPLKDDKAQELQGWIVETRGNMETAAEAFEYDRAMTEADELEAGLASLETFKAELAKKRAEFEARRDDLMARVGDVLPTEFPPLEEQEKQVFDHHVAMDAAAQEENYDEALSIVDRAEAAFKAVETGVVKFEALRTDYEAKRASHDERVSKVSGETEAKPALTLLNEALSSEPAVDDLALEWRFEEAMNLLVEIGGKLTTLEAFNAEVKKKETEYEGRAEKIGPRVDEATTAAFASLSEKLTEITDLKKEMEAAADTYAYGEALRLADLVDAALDGYEAAAERLRAAKEAFDTKKTDLKLDDRLATAAEEVSQADLVSVKASVEEKRADMDAQIESHDYEAALNRLLVLDASLTTLEGLKEALAAQKKELEAALVEIDAELGDLLTPCPSPAVGEQQQRLKTSRDGIDDYAAAEDYQGGLDVVDAIRSQMAMCEEAIADFRAQEEAYKKRLAELADRLKTAQEPVTNDYLKNDQNEVEETRGEAEAAAQTFDFVAALDLLEVLETKLSGFETHKEEIAAQREAYEEGLDKLLADLDEALVEVPNAEITSAQEELPAIRQAMEAEAQKENFNGALDYKTSLIGRLATCQTLLEAFAAAKQAYEDKTEELRPRVEVALVESQNKDLMHGRAMVSAWSNRAKEAAEAADYATAMAELVNLESTLDAYDKLVEKVEGQIREYEDRRDALAPKLEEILPDCPDQMIQEWQRNAVSARDDAKAAAAAEDYEAALVSQETAELQVTMCAKGWEEFRAREKAFTDKRDALEPGLKAAAEAVENPALQSLQGEILAKRDEMTQQGDAGDFKPAIVAADWLATALEGYEGLKQDIETAEASYEEQRPAVQTRLEEARKSEGDRPANLDLGAAEKNFAEMEKAASGGDYQQALAELVTLEAELAAFEGAMEAFAAAKQAYADKTEELRPRVEVAMVESQNKDLMHGRAMVSAWSNRAKEAAEAADYTTALAELVNLESTLDAYDKLVEKVEGQIKEYEDRRDALAPKLEEILPDCPDQMIQEWQRNAVSARDDAKAAAAAEDYEAALVSQETAELQVTMCAKGWEEFRAREKAFTDKRDALEPRIKQALEPVANEYLKNGQAQIESERKAVDDAAAKPDLDAAEKLLLPLEATLEATEAYREEIEAQRRDYEEGLAQLLKDVEEASAAIPLEAITSKQEHMLATKAQMETDAAREAFTEALDYKTSLKSQVVMIVELLADHRARQQAYEDKLKSLAGPLKAAAVTVKYPALVNGQTKIAEQKAAAEQLATEIKFDEALSCLENLEELLVGFQTLLEQRDARKQEYDTRYAATKDRIEAASETDYASLFDSELQIKRYDIQSQEAAKEEDYGRALDMLDTLMVIVEVHSQTVAKFEALEAEYDKRNDALKPGLKTAMAPSKNIDLPPLQEKIEELVELKRQATEQEHDFEYALMLLTELEALVKQVTSIQADIAAEKKVFEDRFAKLEGKIDAAWGSGYPQLESLEQGIVRQKTNVTEAADAEDYDIANDHLDALMTIVARQEEMVTQYKADEAELKDLMKILAPALKTSESAVLNPRLTKLKADIKPLRQEIAKLVKENRWEKALVKAHELEPLTTEFMALFEDIDAERKRYTNELPAIETRLDAAQGSGYPLLVEVERSLVERRGMMEEAAARDDFDAALASMDRIKAMLAGHETAMTKYRELEQRYDKRRDEVADRLAEVSDPLKDDKAGKLQSNIQAAFAQAEDLAAEKKHEQALFKLDDVASGLVTLESFIRDLEAERTTYTERLAGLKERLNRVDRFDGEALEAERNRIDSLRGEMEAAAARDDFDRALGRMDKLVAELTVFESRLEEEMATA